MKCTTNTPRGPATSERSESELNIPNVSKFSFQSLRRMEDKGYSSPKVEMPGSGPAHLAVDRELVRREREKC